MKIERRMAVDRLEIREADGAAPLLSGYASTFSQPYDMGWYREEVAPGAFKRSLGRTPDVRLLINHGGLPLARTTSGTLTLAEDSTGLKVEARLDPSDPDVAALLPKMRRGDLNQMSFGFRVLDDGDEWSGDMSRRTLRHLDINDGDVSVVTYPANPGTSAAVRGDGVAIDAVRSAMRALEARDATSDDIVSVLTRALGFFTAVDLDATPAPVEESLPDPSDSAVARSASAVLELRRRTLRLLG